MVEGSTVLTLFSDVCIQSIITYLPLFYGFVVWVTDIGIDRPNMKADADLIAFIIEIHGMFGMEFSISIFWNPSFL